jgi:hypothetical protein
MKATALVDTPPQFRTPSFIALRNKWYRKAEASGGIVIDELGYKNGRERAKRSGPHVTMLFSVDGGELDASSRSPHDNADAEYWGLMSEWAAKLPDQYRGTAFLRAWAEMGEAKGAAARVGISRWAARKYVIWFTRILRRKKVLR